MNFVNDFTFSGEVFYLKELVDSKEFSYSIKIRGVAKRDFAITPMICELSCLILKNVNIDKVKLHEEVCVSGHIEFWERKNKKNMFIVDAII